MDEKITRTLIVAPLLLSFLLWPSFAGAQQRGLALGGVRYYALIIGNNAYASLPRLKTAEADARAVERLLREDYGFQTKLLLNATRSQIVAALSTYRRELAPDTNLLIYYAGHGYNDKDADKAYWLPVDASLDDNSNWIIADEITTAIKVVPARHVLVVSDSCYSGTLTRGLGDPLPRATEREQFLRRMAAGRSRTLMASGGDEPVADGGGRGHSVFASALLRGLREMDRTQFTAAELFRSYVEEAVAGRANQTPEYNPLRNSGHESGDFVFVKIKGGGQIVEGATDAPPANVSPAQQELAFWTAIQNSVDADDFKDYLAKYPTGLYAGIARRRVAALTAAPTASPATGGAAAGAADTTLPPAPAADAVVPSGWTRYELGQPARFSLILPVKPTETSERVNFTPTVKVTVRNYMSLGATGLYGATYMEDLPAEASNEATKRTIFESFVKGFAEGFEEQMIKNGATGRMKMLERRAATAAGLAGYEQDFSFDRMTGRVRLVYDGARAYAVLSFWSDPAAAADRAAFFESLRVNRGR